jgi:hypothetical protein
MGGPDIRPGFSYEVPTLKLSDIQAMRRIGLDNSDNRIRLTSMIDRVASSVLEEFSRPAKEKMYFSSAKRRSMTTFNYRGERVINFKYASLVGGLAIAFEWGEENSDLHVLSARLYQHEVGLTAEAATDPARQEELILPDKKSLLCYTQRWMKK